MEEQSTTETAVIESGLTIGSTSGSVSNTQTKPSNEVDVKPEPEEQEQILYKKTVVKDVTKLPTKKPAGPIGIEDQISICCVTKAGANFFTNPSTCILQGGFIAALDQCTTTKTICCELPDGTTLFTNATECKAEFLGTQVSDFQCKEDEVSTCCQFPNGNFGFASNYDCAASGGISPRFPIARKWRSAAPRTAVHSSPR